MSEKRLRGTRLGSISLETEEGVDFVQTQSVTFRTNQGDEFAVTFMEGVDLPYEWTSPHTGQVGRRLDAYGNPVEGVDPNARLRHPRQSLTGNNYLSAGRSRNSRRFSLSDAKKCARLASSITAPPSDDRFSPTPNG